MMSWWSSSWLPTIPSIDFTLPSTIQRRFISFALRQTLGHFLKPGQLDIQQVDSQIGSGYVQVRDVELDNNAINSLIAGLPLQLHDGSAGKVTARIPWPNPLTSSVGLSLESLHLTFTLSPTISKENQPASSILAESVASVADTFIHEELSPPEEASLLESFHHDLNASVHSLHDNVPGGLDSFTSDDVHGDSDPPGVSIFATLLERLLSRFEFDASDTRITIVHPEHASFTLTVPEVRYRTDVKETKIDVSPTDAEAKDPREAHGVVRTVTISGVTVTSRCLRPPSPQPLTPFASSPVSHYAPSTQHPSATPSPPSTPVPSSPFSDTSDLDEETQLLMSQSIVALPPRPPSPASSVASSMYQSAISTTSSPQHRYSDFEHHHPHSMTPPPGDQADSNAQMPPCSLADDITSLPPPLRIPANEIEDETIVSLGTEPIVVRLTTSPPLRSRVVPTSHLTSSPISPSSPLQEQKEDKPKQQAAMADIQDDKLRIEVTMGTLAIALRARHLRNLIDIAQLWTSRSPAPLVSSKPPSAKSNEGGSTLFDRLEATLRVRGIVVILLPAKSPSSSDPDDPLVEYFSRPLIPPSLKHGYVRAHLESIMATLSIQPSSTVASTKLPALHAPRITGNRSVSSSLSLSELSAFAFLSSDSTGTLLASPILITDPHLPSHYSTTHTQPDLRQEDAHFHLPTFDTVDWTSSNNQTNSAKLSRWRARPIHERSSAPDSPFRKEEEFLAQSPPRIPPINLPSSPGRVGLAGLSTSPGKSSELPRTYQQQAITVKLSMTLPSRTSHSKRRAATASTKVDVSIAPLHTFIDLGLMLDNASPGCMSETMAFMEELTAAPIDTHLDSDENEAEYDSEEPEDDEDADTPPGTPRANESFRLQGEDQEKERKRLERLVLEDLDLGFDYTRKTTQRTTGRSNSRVRAWRKQQSKSVRKDALEVMVKLPMIRIQLRGSPPPSSALRSGAVVVDVHDLRLSSNELTQTKEHSIKFSDPQEANEGAFSPSHENAGKLLLSADWKRIVIAYCPLREERASAILSLGSSEENAPSSSEGGLIFDSGRPSSNTTSQPRPHIVVSQLDESRKRSTSSSRLSTTAVAILIPSVYVNLSKPQIDGLQLWADDLSQLVERAFNPEVIWDSDTERAISRDPSLIGSRFFTKLKRSRDRGSGSGSAVSAEQTNATNETIIKITVSEAALRLALPRQAESGTFARPFDIMASDIDVLLEVKPEGKDETVITIGVMDVNVFETAKSGARLTFLALTTPRNMTATVRSLLKLRFTSLVVPGTTAKESRVKATLCGITYNLYADFDWIADLGRFVKAPPGAFESVVPSERTRVSVKIVETSVRAFAPVYPGAVVLHVGEVDFNTVIVGNLPEMSLHLAVQSLSLFLIDDTTLPSDDTPPTGVSPRNTKMYRTGDGPAFWKGAGYALLAELTDFDLRFLRDDRLSPPDSRVNIDQACLRIHLCADTATALTVFINDLNSVFANPVDEQRTSAKLERKAPTRLAEPPRSKRGLMASLDEHAFRRKVPEVGAAPDMINDDLPTNPDYLDDSFSTTAGLRELPDDDDDFGEDSMETLDTADQPGVVSKFGGETIRILHPEGLNIIEHHFDTLRPGDDLNQYSDTILQVRVQHCGVTLFLYDGYDWPRTRRIIEEEAKNMRRKLAKIRQLVANGQTPDPSVEETNALLFNSVYIGLEHNIDELEPDALIAAIDEELNEELETASQSSWQSLKPQSLSPGKTNTPTAHARRKASRRSRGPSIEFRLLDLSAEVDQYRTDSSLASRTLVTVREIEILDHIKTSTWKKFLTNLRTDSKGNIRETDSNMARVELLKVYPVPGHPTEEARLRAKILPLRLHVDQDALDFLKKFFSFKDPEAASPPSTDPAEEIYFQQAEIFPVDIKLDYKPRRVDYRALRDGRTIELMNFFHFDGAEMTLRHITLTGITGWARVFDLLNDLWTPDVKATQLVDVISGVSPIRSVVNVGSGVADLVLLPIAQYRKDGRVVRGLQKGTTAFVKSTATEAIKLGARLATGTQVILEQTETVLGGQFKDPITAEALQISPIHPDLLEGLGDNEDADDLISRYADQPTNVQEGVRSAYKSLKKNLNSAAQTILAVPMEVYERSGNEGTVRAVVRAVPIAVLKPMIGATEAVSKTLLGLHNTLDPGVRLENEAKYKHR